MTDDCCDPPHPLVRDGTSQGQRLPEMLLPKQPLIDDRSLEDLLIWATGYAEQLAFYDLSDQPKGDWTPFMRDDIATLIAVVSKTDTGTWMDRFLAAKADANGGAPGIDDRINRFKELCGELLRLAEKLETWRRISVEGLALRKALDTAIKSELSPSMRRLKSYDLGAGDEGALGSELGLDFTALGSFWNLDGVAPDSSIFDGTTDDLKIDYATERISALFGQMHQSFVRLVGNAGAYMDEALKRYPQHRPHFALFLSFLQLFDLIRDELNRLGRKHLDFYFQHVLRLAPRPATPDRAHLIAEIAKNRPPYPLRKGTLFKDGKDGKGVDVRYGLDREVVLNRASVAEIRAVFVDRDKSETRVHVSEKAASSDGQGGEFADGEEPRWKTFGQHDKAHDTGENTARLQAYPGIAIASPMFHLEGGVRTIGVTLVLQAGTLRGQEDYEAKMLFTAHLTTAEGWHQVRIEPGNDEGADDVAGNGAAPLPVPGDGGGEDGRPASQVGQLPVDAIQGIGPVYKRHLEQAGIDTVAKLGAIDPDEEANSISALALWEFRVKAEQLVNFSPGPFAIKSLLERTIVEILSMTVPDLADAADQTSDAARAFQFDLRRIQALMDEPVLATVRLKDFIATRPGSAFGKSTAIGSEFAGALAPGSAFGRSIATGSELAGALAPRSAFGTLSAARAAPKDFGTRGSTQGAREDAIRLKIVLQSDVPPITAFNPEIHGDGFGTNQPVLKLVADQAAADANYESLSIATMTGIDVAVAVSELRSMVLETGLGPAPPDKPFIPFGALPRTGSSLIIGSWEAFQKSLSDLWLKVAWLAPPGDFLSYYSDYDEDDEDKVSGNKYFTCSTALLSGRSWRELNGKPALFAENSADQNNIVILERDPDEPGLEPAGPTKRAPDLRPFDRYGADLPQGFIRLDLKEDFRHGLFNKVYAGKAIEKATAEFPETVALPTAPYTPTINSITLNYTTVVESIPLPASKPSVDQVFHLHPFGHAEITYSNPPVLPRFEILERSSDDGTQTLRPLVGALLIGFKDLSPPQALSILFQVAEGSANPFVPLPPIMTWSYLKSNEWIAFDQDEILREDTGGLLRSGIIQFSVPSAADSAHTILPSEMVWLRGAVAATPDGVCDMIGIHSQALPVTFTDRGNDPVHYEEPLAAGGIGKMVQRDAAIAKLEQPYASFGARPAEEQVDELGRNRLSPDYYRRICERLRHKDRGISIWDYERLVLENFPAVYKAKCLSHTDRTSELAPGAVTVVTVANLRNQNAVDLLAPRASQATLQQIRQFLSERISPVAAAGLEVVNPDYERIATEFDVRFRSGFDVGYYKGELRDSLIRFLSPWAYSDGADIAFGGRIHGSAIVDFIDEQDYVDAVLNFRMYLEDELVSEAAAGSARSILASAADHRIEVLE